MGSDVLVIGGIVAGVYFLLPQLQSMGIIPMGIIPGGAPPPRVPGGSSCPPGMTSTPPPGSSGPPGSCYQIAGATLPAPNTPPTGPCPTPETLAKGLGVSLGRVQQAMMVIHKDGCTLVLQDLNGIPESPGTPGWLPPPAPR